MTLKILAFPQPDPVVIEQPTGITGTPGWYRTVRLPDGDVQPQELVDGFEEFRRGGTGTWAPTENATTLEVFLGYALRLTRDDPARGG